MPRLPALLLISLFLFAPFTVAQAESEPGQKAVLVTGASSGLGRSMTEMMAAKGYFVYAGARKDKDMEALNAIENVQAVRLDVTRQDEIDAAVKTITDAGRGLYGLVNNAGVLILSPLIETDEKDFHLLMDVNVYGPYRITRAFAPLIIESRGRIAIISSIAGVLSSSTWGPYAMTKHAMEAFGDALADEMKRFDVQVSLIEPGTYQSKILESAMARANRDSQAIDGSVFQEEVKQNEEWLSTALAKSGDPQDVSRAVMMALFDDSPRPRYMVVPNEEQGRDTINRSMQKLIEMNDSQAYRLDHAELVEMLDEAMAEPTR